MQVISTSIGDISYANAGFDPVSAILTLVCTCYSSDGLTDNMAGEITLVMMY